MRPPRKGTVSVTSQVTIGISPPPCTHPSYLPLAESRFVRAQSVRTISRLSARGTRAAPPWG